jgi:superfamily II DNA or RNA helicase
MESFTLSDIFKSNEINTYIINFISKHGTNEILQKWYDNMKVSSNIFNKETDMHICYQKQNMKFIEREAALNQLKCYLQSGNGSSIIGPVSATDRQQHSRVFELCSAYELGHTMWECLPPTSFDNGGAQLMRMSYSAKNPRDMGIDSATIDMREVSQSKWYKPGSQVNYTDISKFWTLSSIVEAQTRILVTSENVNVHKLSNGLPIKKIHISDTRINEICTKALSWLCETKIVNTQDNQPLRKWQSDAIEIIGDSLLNYEGEPVTANIACGSGKSRLILELIKRNKYKRSLIFVPSKGLLNQFCKEVTRWTPNLSVGRVGDRSIVINKDITVCIYDSVKHVKDLEFDFIVVDEAHRVAKEFLSEDDTYGKVRAREILDMCDDTPILLVSATIPDIDNNILSYEYNIDDAIRDCVIVDYHIVIPVFTDGDHDNGLRNIIHVHPEWTRILAYCNTILKASEFAEECVRNGIPAKSFSGKTPLKEREYIIDELRLGKIRVLVTVYTLSEGIDIKEADTCMFVDQRYSSVDVIQCLGRILRTSPGKQIGTVILPTLDENRELVRFMRLLEGADPRLRYNLWKSRGRTSVVIDSINDMSEETAEMISINVYERLGVLLNAWQENYELLKQFVLEFKKFPKKSTKIGDWISNQRRAKKNDKMSIERIEKLESIPGWLWEQNLDEEWQTNCDLLEQFVEEFKKLPLKKTEYKEVKIGSWMSNNRHRKKIGKMTTERIEKLDAIPGWVWELDIDEEWQLNYDLIIQFVDEFNKLPLTKTEYQEVKIGSWMSQQRVAKKNDKMSIERIADLEKIPGWIWGTDWESRYNLLVQFVYKFKKLPLKRTEYKEVKIGNWMTRQHAIKKGTAKGKLTQKRIEKLEAIPGWKW